MNLYNNFGLCVDDDPTFWEFGRCLEVSSMQTTNFKLKNTIRFSTQKHPATIFKKRCKNASAEIIAYNLLKLLVSCRTWERSWERNHGKWNLGVVLDADIGCWRFLRRNYYAVNEIRASNLKNIYGNFWEKFEFLRLNIKFIRHVSIDFDIAKWLLLDLVIVRFEEHFASDVCEFENVL